MHFFGLQAKGLQAAISRKALHVYRKLHHVTGTAGKSPTLKSSIQLQGHKNAVSFIGMIFLLVGLVSQEVSHFLFLNRVVHNTTTFFLCNHVDC